MLDWESQSVGQSRVVSLNVDGHISTDASGILHKCNQRPGGFWSSHSFIVFQGINPNSGAHSRHMSNSVLLDTGSVKISAIVFWERQSPVTVDKVIKGNCEPVSDEDCVKSVMIKYTCLFFCLDPPSGMVFVFHTLISVRHSILSLMKSYFDVFILTVFAVTY